MTEYSGHVEINPESFSLLLSHAISSPDALFMVIEDSGAVVGGILGMIEPFYFNFDRKKAQLVFWYCETSSRDNLELWTLFEKWAESNGVTGISAGCNCSIMRDKFEKFWTRRGYAPLETHFIKWGGA